MSSLLSDETWRQICRSSHREGIWGEYQDSPSSTLNGVSGEIHFLAVLKEYKMWSIELGLKDFTLDLTINVWFLL